MRTHLVHASGRVQPERAANQERAHKHDSTLGASPQAVEEERDKLYGRQRGKEGSPQALVTNPAEGRVAGCRAQIDDEDDELKEPEERFQIRKFGWVILWTC